ncbi:MAG: hypothetical protein IJ036_02565 [Lachnospiraceae bacterium]|nr:hypothetical protein [Lachnospiraceae bacterium]
MNKKNFDKKEAGKLLAIALVSLLIWTGSISQSAAMPVIMTTDREAQPAQDQMTNQLAWWGSLYPRICLKGAMRLVEEPEAGKTREEPGENSDGWNKALPIKIKWKCRDLF